jgi:hypothetical protein
MGAEATMLNYGKPFGFFFQDKDWFKKFAIASLLTYTLIGAAPVIGWTIDIVRRVAQDEEPIFPELNNWKLYWKLGGRFAFVNAVWLLPLLFAVVVLYLPLVFVNQLANESLLAVFGGTLLCVVLFLLIYFIVYGFLLVPMLVALSRGDSAWQAMNPVRLWKLARPHFTEYLIVFLVVGVALTNVVLFVGALTLFLLLPPLLVYAGLVAAHYAGQLGKANA